MAHYTNLDNLSKTILIISIIVILFSFAAPVIFIQDALFGIDFINTGPIGDTIGGIMNPFIAVAGILITFLAFYIQFKANKLQKELFRQELDSNKFENQFYEMLSLHKENVNEFQIEQFQLYKPKTPEGEDNIHWVRDTIKGRKIFKSFIAEFQILYLIAKYSFPNNSPKDWVNEAYGIFYLGIKEDDFNKHDFFKYILKVKHDYEENNYSNLNYILYEIMKVNINEKDIIRYELFQGHSSQLAHYYRHLFQTVKFVVNQDPNKLNYQDKRRYLRILRAQLSNQEQTMLFYNWFSKFGKQWENENNKFFTDYRMIHNIYPEILVKEIRLTDVFNFENGFKKEDGRQKDSLFEYQDW